MKTIVLKANNPGAISHAADIIKGGGLVAFPTETVYGLGGNALDNAACAKIYEAKGRPSDNPLISHVADVEQLKQIVSHITQSAEILIKQFWPGPLTIIFPEKNSKNTIGVRMPENPTALDLIRRAGVPVAAPSANISGSPSPTTAEHVLNDLDGKIDMILDGGKCLHGLESTVIDCTVAPAAILRPGAITKEMIEGFIGSVILATEAGKNTPKAPGMKYRHYAPKARLTVVVGENNMVIDNILRLTANVDVQYAVMAHSKNIDRYLGRVVINMGAENKDIAANLFALLRKCDDMGLKEVFVEGVAETGLGLAIMNRLKKAASFNILEV